MRSTLYLKFTFIYIIFGFLSIFTIATLGSELVTSRLEKNTGAELYKEANLIATDYCPDILQKRCLLLTYKYN